MVTRRLIRVGTRGSTLALRQTELVLERLRKAWPDVVFEVVTVTTAGDRDTTTPVQALGVGAFVTEVEKELADLRIDIGVHSYKDLPTVTAKEFKIAALTKREDPRDVLVNRWNSRFKALPQGARVGTSSPRRRAQLLSMSPKLKVLPIRGNVDTRLKKCMEDRPFEYDAIVLAAAGLARIGRLDVVADFLDPAMFVPAVGQGIIALETRTSDVQSANLLKVIDDAESRVAATAERAFLHEIGGGCLTPLGAYARLHEGTLGIFAFVSDPDGRRPVRDVVSGPPEEAAQLGKILANRVLGRGARRLLAEKPREESADASDE